MLFVPFPVIVSWPVPNYKNPETRPKEILVASFLFLFLAIIIVGLRVWTRVTIRRFVGADDFLVIFALVGPPSPQTPSNYVRYARGPLQPYLPSVLSIMTGTDTNGIFP
jgi:hypothetical protein